MVAGWVSDILSRVGDEDEPLVMDALRRIASDLVSREASGVSRACADILAWITASDQRLDVDTPSNGGHLTVFRSDDDEGPHAVLVIVYVVQGVLDYAAVYFFDLY